MSISQPVLDVLMNAPQPGDTKEDFNEKAWPFAAILYQLGLELNSTVANLNLDATMSTSTTSFAIGSSGTNRTFTVQANKSYAIGMTVRVAVTADGSKFIQGIVTAYNATTGSMTVAVNQISGSGTFAAWTISQAIAIEPIGLGADVASAASPNIWLNDGRSRNYNGVVDTTGFANAPYAGAVQYLRITNGVKFIGGANLQVPGGTCQTETGDLVMVFAKTNSTFQLFIMKANGQAVVATPVSSASIPDNTILRKHLSTGVARKVKGFGTRSLGDKAYMQMVVQTEDSFLLGWGRADNHILSTANSTNETWPPTRPAFYPAIPAGQTIVDWCVTGCSIFAVLSNGWVYSCGINTYGQLGQGDTTSRDTFTRIEYFVTNSISISKVVSDCGRINGDTSSTFFLNASGEVWSCGYNTSGQLGLGDTSNRSTPVKVTGLIGVTKLVFAGAYHGAAFTFALKNDGTLYAAGNNAIGQLGVGDNTSKNSFTLCTGLSGVVVTDIAAAVGTTNTTPSDYGAFALLLTAAKEVYSTGFNAFGQLGQGTITPLNAFTKISALSDIVSIGCMGGYYGYSFAVSTPGRLYTWGYNGRGAIGDGTTTARTSPYNVSMYNTVSKNAVTAVLTDPPFIGKIKKVIQWNASQGGSSTTIVLDNDGNLWLAGLDNYIFTGATAGADKTRFTPLLPTKLTALDEKLIDFAVTGYDSAQAFFAISDLGYLYGCGYNNYGLALAAQDNKPAFVPSMQRVNI